jgi:hypothetical protein
MAQSVTLNNQTFTVGQRVVAIDNLPANSKGFTFTLDRDSSWDAEGHLFDFDIEQSADGASWQLIAHGNMEGGPAGVDRLGNPLTAASWEIRWAVGPGGVVDRKSDARIVFNTARAFTSPKVTLAAF